MKNNSEILIYANSDGKISLDVRLEDETVWLTQAHMAELFGKSKQTAAELVYRRADAALPLMGMRHSSRRMPCPRI